MKRSTVLSATRLAQIVALALSFIFLFACASSEQTKKTETLNRNMRIFNLKFESKRLDNLIPLVQDKVREDFSLKTLEFQERVTFYNSTLLNLKYYKGDQLLTLGKDGLDEGFDKAVATVRYQFIVAPGTVLQTEMVKQEWVYENEGWYVIPELEPFLK